LDPFRVFSSVYCDGGVDVDLIDAKVILSDEFVDDLEGGESRMPKVLLEVVVLL
jgi:hypothetical protein